MEDETWKGFSGVLTDFDNDSTTYGVEFADGEVLDDSQEGPPLLSRTLCQLLQPDVQQGRHW